MTPRLSIVTSSVHHFTTLSAKASPKIFDSMNNKATAKMATRYFDSKLLEILYGRMLAPAMTRSGKPPVTLNFVNPGFCASDLVRDPSLAFKIQSRILARSTEEGSRTLVAAVVAGNEDTHGQYLTDTKIARHVAAVAEKG